ncbi:hypothetical protein C2845_PM02G36270 [Panicum miliaceum]|uniref:Pectinesterase catalytic domain-containing protein n=1 Tax=Panicum miliaceum TaxID=4540 RepID=A0A3L6SE95_PANMI|nr:hypothetical protein C2845_PM02G36270 [Panicum miliaceum]
MPSISPADLLVCSGRCSTERDLRLLHAALIRRRHILPTADAVKVLAKLLRFAAVSPAGDLRHASSLLSLHLPFISAAASHLAFFYNTLMRGFATSSSPGSGIELFTAMRRAGAGPDAFTFTFVLKSFSRCHSPGRLPCDLHAQAFKHGCLGARSSHAHVHNALLHAYASRAAVDDARRVFDEIPVRDVVSFSGLLTAHLKGNRLDSARMVFDQMPHRDVVSWTAMISAYAKAQRPQEALALFDAMPVQPDEVTMVSVVSACTALGDLATGERLRQCLGKQLQPVSQQIVRKPLHLHGGKQFFRNCYIEGNYDFIFGDSTALLEHCRIHCKSRMYYCSWPEILFRINWICILQVGLGSPLGGLFLQRLLWITAWSLLGSITGSLGQT